MDSNPDIYLKPQFQIQTSQTQKNYTQINHSTDLNPKTHDELLPTPPRTQVHPQHHDPTRVVKLDGSFVFHQRPLDLINDTGEDGNDVIALGETDDCEIATSELNVVVLVDEVENGARDLDKDLFDGLQQSRG
nr:hypothetical protein CFP56_69911 [Quercus suber]